VKMQQSNQQMRVVKFDQYGGPDVLQLRATTCPEPGIGEVRVKMQALALNRANSLFRTGKYLFEAQFPSRIGTEGVGVIDAIGKDVSGFTLGQRVNLLPPINESESGYAADYNTVKQETLLPSPTKLDSRHSATVWVPFLTLYHLFVEQGLATSGKWVVLPAASSSVSLAANQLARFLGAKTIGITRTSTKLTALKKAGYDAIVVAEDEDISKRIIEISAGGADFVFDPVGGPQLEPLINSVKRGALINIYGLLDDAKTNLPIFALMNSGATLRSYTVYELVSDPQRMQAAIEYFLPLFEAGHLTPVVDEQHYSLDQIQAAFSRLESNNQLGKVVVSI
jgi:NADPH2:quinone reductase